MHPWQIQCDRREIFPDADKRPGSAVMRQLGPSGVIRQSVRTGFILASLHSVSHGHSYCCMLSPALRVLYGGLLPVRLHHNVPVDAGDWAMA